MTDETPLRSSGTDEHEARRRSQVRPAAWVNPTPAARYDLVVIGAGTAGLVCAMGAASLGARVAVAERHLLGGDCLNTGCVPSKSLIHSARMAANGRVSPEGGVAAAVTVDFGRVMQRLRARRATIAAADSVARLTKAGVDVFFGDGRFLGPDAVGVGHAVLRFRKAVVATGARPVVPRLSGLLDVPYLTNETVFETTTLPSHLLVLGAGPIGCELAQAFARLGAAVTIVGHGLQPLPREDAEAAALVRQRMERDGVRFELGVGVEAASYAGRIVSLDVSTDRGAGPPRRRLDGDALLIAVGRAPNVEHLGLADAGIAVEASGVVVDDRLRTTNSRVYASGDVCSAYKFTHAADALSRIVVQNALFFGRRKASALVIPRVTFTSPEIAHVGVTSHEVANSGGRLQSITVPLSEIDRAVVDDDVDGFVRVHHERGRLRGTTIVSTDAGEMLGEAVFALTHGGTLGDFAATIHPYPTRSEAFRKVGDAYRRQGLTPMVARWLVKYFRWTR